MMAPNRLFSPTLPLRLDQKMTLVSASRQLACCVALAWLATVHAAQPPLWFDGSRPSAQAHQAVALLADAASHGLAPQDYGVAALQRDLALAAQGPAPEPLAQSGLDDALSAAMQRFLADLHLGRIDPRQIHARFDVPPGEPFDPAAVLQAALAAQRLPQAVREAAPRLSLYEQLRETLAQYRALGDHPAWLYKLPMPRGRKLAPLQAWDGLALLAGRLQVLGDLPADIGVPALYEGPLVDAVQAFQRRHGLTDDAVIGRATLAALDVAPAQRVRQIELTLERLRWTPLQLGPRMIVVNVPEFMLRAYEIRDDQLDVRLEMKVIVGRALDTRTPLFNETMRFIEFSPYWNVPRSIASAELVPRLQREPTYFTRQGFEFVGRDGLVSAGFSSEQLDAVLHGELRIRQRPGPENALGDIKFVFPNNDAIYLHHTSSPGLFERDRRDFSHGCIRVQEPVALAKFVLQEQPEWPEARIVEAMARGESRTLRLDRPVPVLIDYATVRVKQGRPYFFADLYGHDQLLDQALRKRRRR
jgi:murein L,D-transpeptidase YcbB/YkuD